MNLNIPDVLLMIVMSTMYIYIVNQKLLVLTFDRAHYCGQPIGYHGVESNLNVTNNTISNV